LGSWFLSSNPLLLCDSYSGMFPIWNIIELTSPLPSLPLFVSFRQCNFIPFFQPPLGRGFPPTVMHTPSAFSTCLRPPQAGFFSPPLIRPISSFNLAVVSLCAFFVPQHFAPPSPSTLRRFFPLIFFLCWVRYGVYLALPHAPFFFRLLPQPAVPLFNTGSPRRNPILSSSIQGVCPPPCTPCA